MTEAEMIAKIKALPGDGGWWHRDGEDTYCRPAGQLVGLGLAAGQAVELLEAAYSAAAGEFGG